MGRPTALRPPNLDSAVVASELTLELQRAVAGMRLPSKARFRCWATAALVSAARPVELVIRVVDETESAALNATYRHKLGPTNVLSFPFEAPPGVDSALLGDLAICAPVVIREAREQGKPVLAHWAHMVVHGVLHLQGYDHMNSVDADEMESLERRILGQLGYPDPYH